MHHRDGFQVPQVHFAIPVDGVPACYRYLRGTTPTLPPLTALKIQLTQLTIVGAARQMR